MAFFDDISKKLSDVSQATIQKTKDMTDTMKYSSVISDEEKSIKTNYAKLGELYYNEIKDCAEGVYGPIVAQINESVARIEECRIKIEEIRSANKCPNCGASISSDDLFCAACGTKIERRETASPVCSNCGKPLNSDAAFCIYCGTKLERTVSSNADDEQETTEKDSEGVECTPVENITESSSEIEGEQE